MIETQCRYKFRINQIVHRFLQDTRPWLFKKWHPAISVGEALCDATRREVIRCRYEISKKVMGTDFESQLRKLEAKIYKETFQQR